MPSDRSSREHRVALGRVATETWNRQRPAPPVPVCLHVMRTGYEMAILHQHSPGKAGS